MKPRTEQKQKNWIPYLVLAIVLVIVWRKYTSNKDEISSTSANINTTQASVTGAQKLASLDANSATPLNIDDTRVQQIDTLLKNLSATFHETPENIANATFVANQQLKRKGIQESNYNILEHMNKEISTLGLRYKEAVLKYVSKK
ncbi:MAG: hypothetical protein ACHQD8_04680 [Chitinophagales bacterium]